jgi:hypothetical protein
MRRVARPLVVIACCALAASSCGRVAESVPSPGADLYAVSPDGVLEVTLTSATERLYAFRWTPEEAFQIVSARRGQEIERCRAGDGFGRLLAAVSSLRVTAELPAPAGGTEGEWARLYIADTSGVEPIVVAIRIPPRVELPVLVEVAKRQFTVATNVGDLLLAASGCKGLGP